MSTQIKPSSGNADAQDTRSRREHGISAYAKVFDVPEQEVPLTARDRSIAIITALTAQGVSGDRLDTHLQLARKHGLDNEALTALMTLLAGYVGYPRASLAMETIHGSSTGYA
ncbi:carboxymuconolactone decarboxylase family protein [Streptomyces sp. NPDC050564]|uniref:carboxymuconolactone decarboxylase family protein n=1 Tax=Streptomyces sp. NPDC050564 TaxID=3365631 RepID=UPI003799A59C